MLNAFKTLSGILSLAVLALLASCSTEDPGPVQEVDKEYAIIDFDRLEMGSGFNIKVEEAPTYSIDIRGDRRNIDDLDVHKAGSTLVIQYNDNANRNHETYITISMPTLRSVNFSGGSVSEVSGFESDKTLDYYLSGGAVSQLDAGYREVKLVLSGGSTLLMHGLGDVIQAEISGASVLTAFEYPVREALVNVSGASSGKLTVTDALQAVVSGSSSLLYRGSPAVSSSVSGASSVQKE